MVDCVQCAFDDVVHLRDADAFAAQCFALLCDKAADKIQLLRRKSIEYALGALVDGGDDFLNVKRLFCAVLFDDVHRHTRPSLVEIIRIATIYSVSGRWMTTIFRNTADDHLIMKVGERQGRYGFKKGKNVCANVCPS